MRFFTDFKEPKDSIIGITNLLSNITQKMDSHKGGWAKLLRSQLWNAGYNKVKILENHDDFLSFDIIIMDLGAEYGGILNLFGGLDYKCFQRVQHFCQLSCPKIYSWHHKLPDLSNIIVSRRSNKSTDENFLYLDYKDHYMIEQVVKNAPIFDHVQPKTHLLIGDSHTPSVWTPDMMIDRTDGQTLYGMCKSNFGSLVKSKYLDKDIQLDELTLYSGNIDIRHHLMRQENPEKSINELVDMMSKELIYLSNLGLKINIVHMLPIENISRKLPKTGYYKGTPFFGDWHERTALHEIFNRKLDILCLKNGWNVYKHPRLFYNELGELDFNVMERPGSVHLSPMHYRWNLNTNKERYDGSSKP